MSKKQQRESHQIAYNSRSPPNMSYLPNGIAAIEDTVFIYFQFLMGFFKNHTYIEEF